MGVFKDLIGIKASKAAGTLTSGAHTSGYVLHDGLLRFPSAAFRELGRGVIKQAQVWINNDNTAAITATLTLWLYSKQIKDQSKNAAKAYNTGESIYLIGKITMPACVSDESYLSQAVKQTIDLYYKTDEEDTAIYGFVTSDGGTFDASATMDLELIVERIL